jgi:hypothetical protein
MSISAMKEALEALEDAEELLSAEDYSTAFQKEAITALRQAIAEAEKQPVHASDISQERVDETAKYRHDLVYRLRKRAEIRRQIPDRKSVQEGQPDRIADLLEEAAEAFESAKERGWVGLTDKERFLNDARSEEEIEYARAIEAKLKEKNT